MKFKMKDTYPPPKRLTLNPLQFLVYIDGYNLYKGINHEDPPDLLRLGWSNYQKLGERLVDLSFEDMSNERTVTVKYFTAIVGKDSGSSGEIQRQKLWLEVLETEARTLEVVGGLHRSYTEAFSDRREKMTDVNIAIHAARDILEVKRAGVGARFGGPRLYASRRVCCSCQHPCDGVLSAGASSLCLATRRDVLGSSRDTITVLTGFGIPQVPSSRSFAERADLFETFGFLHRVVGRYRDRLRWAAIRLTR
jgi:hypothetical protein